LGYAQLLRSQAGLSEEQRKALRVIQGAGEHLLGLIDDILDMAKIEAGTLEIHPEDFDLLELLEGLAAVMRARAAERGLSFTREQWSAIPHRCGAMGAAWVRCSRISSTTPSNTPRAAGSP
jgi:signal transduction histidine kinase